MLSGKVMKIDAIVELIKKIFLYKIKYFSEPYSYRKIKVELDLSYIKVC